MARLSVLLALLFATCTQAFVPVSRGSFSTTQVIQQQQQHEAFMPAVLQRQRKSVAPIQTMGLFGLGVPEIAVCLVAAAFLLGPQKLAELGKDAGKIAGELKEVPKEFQAGLAEGEQAAKEMKAANAEDTSKTEEKK